MMKLFYTITELRATLLIQIGTIIESQFIDILIYIFRLFKLNFRTIVSFELLLFSQTCDNWNKCNRKIIEGQC